MPYWAERYVMDGLVYALSFLAVFAIAGGATYLFARYVLGPILFPDTFGIDFSKIDTDIDQAVQKAREKKIREAQTPVDRWAAMGVVPTAAMVEAEMRAEGMGEWLDEEWKALEEGYSNSIIKETGRRREEVKNVRSYYGYDQNVEVEVEFEDGERWVATVTGNYKISDPTPVAE